MLSSITVNGQIGKDLAKFRFVLVGLVEVAQPLSLRLVLGLILKGNAVSLSRASSLAEFHSTLPGPP